MAFFLAKSHEDLFEAALSRRILLSPILDIAQVSEHPQFRSRNIWFASEGADGTGDLRGRFMRTKPEAFTDRKAAPEVGEANALIYGERLGLTPEEVAGLEAKGVI